MGSHLVIDLEKKDFLLSFVTYFFIKQEFNGKLAESWNRGSYYIERHHQIRFTILLLQHDNHSPKIFFFFFLFLPSFTSKIKIKIKKLFQSN